MSFGNQIFSKCTHNLKYIYVLLYYTILTARTHEMNFNLAIRFLSVFGQIENILYIKGDFLRAI